MNATFFLAPYVRSFFEDHLTCRRNVSRNTIQSYRDALKLLLKFAVERLKVPATKLLVTEVDPILWTKKGHSLATLLPAFLAGNPWLILHRRHACGIAFSPGETEVGSAGEHPAKG